MSLRLLAINPNTSATVTETVLAAARAAAPPGVTIEGVTGRFGARIVTTEAEHVIAAHSALDLAAHHAAGYDGVLLAISFDSGLAALRASLPVPVAGLTGSACAAALAGGAKRPGAVILGETTRAMYHALFAGYGAALAAVEVVELDSVDAYMDPAARSDAVAAAVTRLAEAGADAAVLCGAAVMGMAARLAPAAAIPLHDGTAAVTACLQDIAAGTPPAPRQAGLGEITGLPAPLAALIRGRPD
ncbi:aspartate/glutamate racemase family protein [Mangrovicoccus algicola]|uniref:Hydantoin racemase n=1 Tax=Mangrovicoccus algicola TaxID=2771008 RepID=A0A8J6Z858_9RHOB|nr:aspartate/glutamate racemase family protein [Mangrovicoccus algicola]MBE3637586.1 hydantoin racemase [Mangrovicoccus algicola]